MKHLLFCLVSCLALGLGSAAHAEGTGVPGVDDPKLAAAISKAEQRANPRFCEELAPLWAEAVQRSRAPNSKLMLISSYATIMCAMEKERYEDASQLIVRTEAKYGQQVFFHQLALALHAHLQELDLAVARVEAIARGDNGNLLAETDPAMIFQLNRNLLRAKRTDLRETLWSSIKSSPAYARLKPSLRSSAASNLLDIKAGNGKLSLADTGLVDLVASSSNYAGMLADRRYAAIWPYMEEHAGDGLARLIEADLKLKTERFEASPDDEEGFSDLGYSLLQAGQIGKLLDLTARFREKGSDYGKLSEKGAWIVNYMAIALRADGRQGEALAAMNRLASLKPETHPWVVNYVINHAIALAEDEQHEAALKSLDRAAPVAEKHGSPYARALVAGQRACSHYKLGHADQVDEQLSVLQGLRTDAYNAVIGYAMCAGREDLAIAWALEALASEPDLPTMIDTLQPAYMENLPVSANDEEPYRLLAKSPELAAAFEKVARVVPERFAPLGGRVRILPSRAGAEAARR